ncbi:MAG: hypothetical protein P8I03_13135 [Thalassotalea sp.]|nr:hypothetical protein [Thalassotalea sp.]
MEWMIGFAILLAVVCGFSIDFDDFQSKRNWWVMAGMLFALILLVSGLEELKEIEAEKLKEECKTQTIMSEFDCLNQQG